MKAPLGIHKPRHVLHDAEDRHIGLLEHRDRFPGIDERHLLGRCHDHSPRQGDCLDNRQLDVTRAGREIQQEHIEMTPIHVPEELLGVTGHHRTT